MTLTTRGKGVLAGSILFLAFLAGTHATVPNVLPANPATSVPDLPSQPCLSDNGDGPRPCYWDSGYMGNQRGKSFWIDSKGDKYTLAP